MHEADLDLETDGIPADDEATTSYAIRQLTRVEGEGRLDLSVRDGVVTRARLEIFEAPRYFERLVVGRDPNEVIDIVARICGICPVAYQMSAVHAFEDLFGVTIDPSVRALRRLFYCGEWIESHALHVYLLHAPDFLGYPSAVEMAADHPAIVERGLRLKKVGNRIVGILGGRPIHPVSVRVGGFSRAPSRAELAPLRTDLDTALADALETVRWAATLDPPAGEREPRLVALRHPTEYPMNEGRITSSDGIDVAPGAWTDAFAEHQVPWSNALQARARDGVPYLLGPTARVSLAGDQLHPVAREALAATGLGDALRTSVFRSIVARGVELVHAVAEARDLSTATPHRQSRTPHGPPAPASPHGRPRRRAACSSIATRSTSAGSCATPRSFRRRARTRRPSSTTSRRSPRRSSTCRTRRRRGASSSSSAATTPASAARPTSSTCTWSAGDRHARGEAARLRRADAGRRRARRRHRRAPARHDPPPVTIHDVTAPMPDDLLDATGPVIIVDAVRGPTPGEVVDLPLTALLEPDQATAAASTHALPLPSVLRLVTEMRGALPEGRFIGIAGARFALGAPLSASVRMAIPAATARLGHDPGPRARACGAAMCLTPRSASSPSRGRRHRRAAGRSAPARASTLAVPAAAADDGPC